MARRLLVWAVALVLSAISAQLAVAGARWPHCRPYTVETICPKGHQLCYLKMVYAHRQDPGYDRARYWYGAPKPRVLQQTAWSAKLVPAAKPARRTAVRHAAPMRCGYRCWYKHWPEHNLPFGD